VLRFFLLSKQYRSPLDFAKKDVLDFQAGLVRIYRTLQRVEELTGPVEGNGQPNIQGLLANEQKNDFLTGLSTLWMMT
jgi:cysteinyl-tRNA synthetase